MESNLKLAKTRIRFGQTWLQYKKSTVGIDKKSHMCCRIWGFGGHVLQVEHPLQLKIVFLHTTKVNKYGQTSVYYTNSFRTNHSLQNPKWLGDPKTVYGMHRDPHLSLRADVVQRREH